MNSDTNDSDDNLMLDFHHQINKTLYITTEELSQMHVSSDSLTLLQINCRSLKKILITSKIYYFILTKNQMLYH